MRLAIALLGCGLAFLAGYAASGFHDRQRLWTDDLLIRQMAAETPVRQAPPRDPESHDEVRFTDVAPEWGMDFVYFDGAAGEFHLMETTGGGMAVLDFDGDSFQDIYWVNGSRLPIDTSDRRFLSTMYRNVRGGGCEEVGKSAGVELLAYGQGAASGDFDNDGFADLLVTCFGQCVLFRNNGDGTFTVVTEIAGIASSYWNTSAAFADLDQDGDLDLYVCTYATVSVDQPRYCERGGRRTHCLPSVYAAEPDRVYRNLNDGQFKECSDEIGIRDTSGRGLGLAVADFSGDGAPDIFVANDTSENYLFLRGPGSQFVESALSLGVALTGAGLTMSGMGVACGDFDRNGHLDLYVTNFYQERSVLYQNMGSAGFLESADPTGTGAASRDRLGFGTVFLDANLDGFPDLFVANGHISDNTHMGVPYKMRQQLLLNRDGQRFHDESESAGPYFLKQLLGRGVALLDYNNDGLGDIAVSHILDPAALLVNRTANHGRWLGLHLVGTSSARDGTNAKVRVSVDGQERQFELTAGGGYLSSSDKRLVIGLGDARAVNGLVIEWPSGRTQPVTTAGQHRYYRIHEERTRHAIR